MQGIATASGPDYVRPKRISLKKHPTLDEKWIQDLIAKDPSILGLGDLMLVRKELQQPSGGRLDLLFATGDGEEPGHQYEVEVQLGATDPSHIIRTIEYWDVERTRYPKLKHIAVLVAEDITSRFLNVISLLNKSVPIIAIQMQALEVENHLTVVFTTVVDLSARPDEDRDESPATADRAYWEARAKTALPIVDKVFAFGQKLDSGFALKYNLNFIQINKRGRIVAWFTPTKKYTRIGIKMARTAESEDLKAQLENAGLEVQYEEAGKGGPSYRVFVENEKFGEYASSVEKLLSLGLGGSNDEP
ncbi:MAG TPA: hypothetical protein VEV17_13910 [Bryobacteraceae bacterium]|nr:hypothetical protein [Bryobacteraceae bacterium]